MITELDYSNLLEDDVDTINTDNDSVEIDSEVVVDDILEDVESEPDNDSNSSSEPIKDENVIDMFLKDRGIVDPTKIQFENENGEIENIDFSSLDKDEQLNILKELTNPGLSDHEIEVVNYLRKNKVSFNEVIDYFAEQRLQEYLNENPDAVHPKHYSIDEYTDEDLYLADLKSKYPSFTDDELVSKLNIAKSDENLFSKEVEILRENYKAEEDRAKQEAEYAEQQEYESLKTNLINAAGAFS